MVNRRRKSYGRLLVAVSLTFVSNTVSLSTEKRISRLLPWSLADRKSTIGWTVEERDVQEGSHRVSVGWGSQECSDSLTVDLPTMKDRDSLASSLWPPGLAGAILCRSPLTKELLNDKAVLELGCGVGLTGLVAADTAASCHLTDNDEDVVGLLKELAQESPKKNVVAQYVEWRDEDRSVDIPAADVVLGTDIAYYYFLLRPLMDTVRAYLKPEKSALLIAGQANREGQWTLYHNLLDGCYNQLTDNKEGPWPGSTQMLLYYLEMSKWQSSGSLDEPEIDGRVPIAVILHRTPGMEVISLTDFDYVATEDDEGKMQITF
jgi:SAM-dependent methyltransferase